MLSFCDSVRLGVLRVNLLSFQVLFQCKRYQGTVGAGVIRDFRGAMVGRGDKGLLITTGTFTPDAKREATRDGAPAIDLIDGDHLCDLFKQLKLGVRTEMVEKMTVEPIWFDKIHNVEFCDSVRLGLERLAEPGSCSPAVSRRNPHTSSSTRWCRTLHMGRCCA
jgi:hypothetical protein